MTAWVYNPDDEDDYQAFAGETFTLKANEATPIKSPEPGVSDDYVADHIVSKLGQWGVVKVNGPVEKGKAEVKEDQATVDAAELTYLAATLAWSEDVIVSDQKIRTPYLDAGLTGPPETPETKRARKWRKDYDKRLREAKLA